MSLFMFNTPVTAKATIYNKICYGWVKKSDFSILIDSHFDEPMSIIKSDEWTVQMHLLSNKCIVIFDMKQVSDFKLCQFH